MLIGQSVNHELVNLLGYSKTEIDQLKKQEWHCPSCGQPLVIKNGLINQGHFAHRSKQSCQAFSEGETAEHIQGKALLAEWCQKDQVPYQLEAYLPKLKQRPDVLIDHKTAIEFQCSHLSIERFIERTLNYQRHGYQVIWLVGKAFFLGDRLSSLQRSCINYHQNVGFYLWELDVINLELRCHLHIEETLEGHHLYYETKHLPIGDWSIRRSLAFPEQAQMFVTRYYEGGKLLAEILEKYERNLIRRESKTLNLQEKLYAQGTHLRELASVYFLPITQPLVAKESVIIWRLLFWQCLEEYPLQTLKELNYHFLAKLAVAQPKLHVLPLINHEAPIRLFIKEYLEVLLTFNFIQFNDKQIKLIKRPTPFADSTIRKRVISRSQEKYKHISATPHKDMLL